MNASPGDAGRTPETPIEPMSAPHGVAERGGRSRRRARSVVVAAAAILVIAGILAATLASGSEHHTETPAKDVALATTTVARADLVTKEHFDGALTYAPRGIVHPVGGGTITSLPHVGQILAQGSVVWGVDGQAVGVLFGTTPLYRTLGLSNTTAQRLAVASAHAELLTAQAGLTATEAQQPRGRSASSNLLKAARLASAQVSAVRAQDALVDAQQSLRRAQTPQQGPDVRVVAANLSALGYIDDPADVWSGLLQAAVARWQQRIGAAVTGQITPSDALVVPGPVRIGAVQGQVGAAASGVSVQLTDPERDAKFQVRDGVPPALTPGRRVRVSAAGRSTVGRVTNVATSSGAATVTVDLGKGSSLAHLKATRARMTITTADRRGVLVVPVQALVALASGGFALQLPNGRLMAVRIGTEQNERIQVSGAGIYAGQRVVTVT